MDIQSEGMGMWLSRGSSEIIPESVEQGLKLEALERNNFEVAEIVTFSVANDVAVLVVGRNLRAKGRPEIRLGHSRCNTKSGDTFDPANGFVTAFKRAVRNRRGDPKMETAMSSIIDKLIDLSTLAVTKLEQAEAERNEQ